MSLNSILPKKIWITVGLIIYSFLVYYNLCAHFPSLHYDDKTRAYLLLRKQLLELNTSKLLFNQGWDFIRLTSAFRIDQQIDKDHFKVSLILPILKDEQISKLDSRELYWKLVEHPPLFGIYKLVLSLSDIIQIKKFLVRIYNNKKPFETLRKPKSKELDNFMIIKNMTRILTGSLIFIIILGSSIVIILFRNWQVVYLVSFFLLLIYINIYIVDYHQYNILLSILGKM